MLIFRARITEVAAFEIDLPAIATFDDVLNVIGVIVNAVGRGKITPSEGELLARTVESYAKALETFEFESRLKILEETLKNGGKL